MKSKLKFIIPIVIAVIAIIVAALCIDFTPQERADVSSIMSTAQKYLIENQYEQAIAEFNKVIEIEPKNVDAYLGLAEAYVGMGDTDKAIDILKNGYSLTGDDRLKKKLEELGEEVENILQVSEKNVIPGAEDVRLYSDGTVRCRKNVLSDGSYELEWLEPNQRCMLKEKYDDSDFIIYAEYYGMSGMYDIGAAAVPEVSGNGYTIASNSQIRYTFNFDGQLLSSSGMMGRHQSVEEITFEYPSEKSVIVNYTPRSFMQHTKEQIEYANNGQVKTTYLRNEFTLGYTICEGLPSDSYKLSYFKQDGTLLYYADCEYTEGVEKLTYKYYSLDGELLADRELRKDGSKSTTYVDGEIYSTYSSEYKDNKIISHQDGDVQGEIITENLPDGSVKRTYSEDMYYYNGTGKVTETAKYVNNMWTVTGYDKDGNIIHKTTYEKNKETIEQYNYYDYYVNEWVSVDEYKATFYYEDGGGYSYILYTNDDPLFIVSGINFGSHYKSYTAGGWLGYEAEIDRKGNSKGTDYNKDGTVSGTDVTTHSGGKYYQKRYDPQGRLIQEYEYDRKDNGKGTHYNDDGTVSGTYVTTINNGISYTKHYNTNGKLQQESEGDRKGNSKGIYYNDDGTVSGTYVTTRSGGTYYTKHYDTQGRLTQESEYDVKGNGKSTSYNSNGTVSYVYIYRADGTSESHSYDENGNLIS